MLRELSGQRDVHFGVHSREASSCGVRKGGGLVGVVLGTTGPKLVSDIIPSRYLLLRGLYVY